MRSKSGEQKREPLTEGSEEGGTGVTGVAGKAQTVTTGDAEEEKKSPARGLGGKEIVIRRKPRSWGGGATRTGGSLGTKDCKKEGTRGAGGR